ncbi:MAG: YhcH/YjgK/YiaL family protein [Kiritimatiellales bacterium]|nr:YhcH/YjgK/YiaL family protein [Kiritimatiellota bacterium]MBL7011940.1 YhcH/YjgK/YiaL family protein [Kiritimatiellales bacterium]
MIIDSIKNHTLYPYGDLWAKAFDFLRTATPELEDGKVVLDGDDLFAGINCYETKARADAKLETHQHYVDIQVLLSGTECLEIFRKDGLSVSEPYDPNKDAEFYEVPETAPVRVTLKPGQFIVFFPEDAHMPSLNAGDRSKPVQKVVIKLRADRLAAD